MSEDEKTTQNKNAGKPYDEFEVGEHKIPWFLWVFFLFIISWASVSWIQFFGY